MDDPVVPQTQPDLTPVMPAAPLATDPISPLDRLPPWAKTAGAIGGIIFLIVVISAVFSANSRPKTPVAPTPTPTHTPTPTPIRTLSPIASSSAFLEFEAAIGALSTTINAFNPQDPALTPPVLDLPLGFRN